MGTGVWPQMGPGPAAAPASGGSIWDRIRTGVERLFGPPPEVPLSDPERAYGLRRGLMTAGTSLLAAEGMPFLPALGQAIPAAQQAALNAPEVMRAAQTAQARRQIMSKYAGRADPMSLLSMFQDLLAVGDVEGAKPIAEVLKSMGGSEGVGTVREGLDPATGQPGMFRIPRAGGASLIPGIAPIGGESREALAQQRAFSRENQLVDDYNRRLDVLGYGRLYSTVDGALDNRAAGTAGDGAAQVNALYAFITAMDPASVVREGEVALARASAAIWDTVQGLYMKYLQGESVVVPPRLLKQMYDLMERRMSGVEKHWGDLQQDFVRRGSRWEVDPQAFSPAPQKYRTRTVEGRSLSDFNPR